MIEKYSTISNSLVWLLKANMDNTKDNREDVYHTTYVKPNTINTIISKL